MGVDGISGGGPPVPKGPSAEGAKPSDSSFSLDEAAASGSTTSATTSPTAELERVEAGELSFDAYLDGRVSQATAHLESSVAPEQLRMIREQLREQLGTDPVLLRLVQRVGSTLGSSDVGASGSDGSSSGSGVGSF